MLYKVGTRKSKLSLAQTGLVIDRLATAYLEDRFEVVTIETTGDRITGTALDSIGSKGVFVDTIEQALQESRIDLAVHSMKDMPSACADRLMFADPWAREDARDVLVLRSTPSNQSLPSLLSALPPGAVIGTGSKRRAFQLLRLRPDLQILPIRGNIDTRLRKLAEGQYDGIILAAAGLKRLGLTNDAAPALQFFSVSEMIPAPAQGTLALELRAGDAALLGKLNALADPETSMAVSIERSFLRQIGGDCHLPVGAYAERMPSGWRLRALFGNADGSRLATVSVEASHPVDPDALALQAAEEIFRKLGEL